MTVFFKIFILIIAVASMSSNSLVESRDPFARMSGIRFSSIGLYGGLSWRRVDGTARYTLDGSVPLIIPVFGPHLGVPNSFLATDQLDELI